MAMVRSRSSWSKTMIVNGVTSRSLITWLSLLATMGSYVFPDSEPQETRTQVPAAMGRQSEGSILNASKQCLDYVHVLDWVRTEALFFEIILIIGVWNWYGLYLFCIFVCCVFYLFAMPLGSCNYQSINLLAQQFVTTISGFQLFRFRFPFPFSISVFHFIRF